MSNASGQSETFQSWLFHELERRKSINPKYSIRSFAKQLGSSPATISQVLSGKRPLTLKLANQLASKTEMSPADRKRFFGAIAFPTSASSSSDGRDNFLQLENDVFLTIADWYHFAILSLGEIRGNRWNADWISTRLGISLSEARRAMQRLSRLGLIERRGLGFKQSGQNLVTKHDVPSDAVRANHRQILEKSLSALTSPVDQREFGSLTIAADARRLPEIKSWLRKTQRDFVDEFGSDTRNNGVFNLAMHFFRLDYSTSGSEK